MLLFDPSEVRTPEEKKGVRCPRGALGENNAVRGRGGGERLVGPSGNKRLRRACKSRRGCTLTAVRWVRQTRC